MDKEKLKRYNELKDKFKNIGELTTAEFEEFVSLKPEEFRKAPNLFSIGGIDPQKSFQNLEKLSGRARKAFECGYFLEAISIRTLLFDLLLRIYIVNATHKDISISDKTTLGGMINLAARSGLDKLIVNRLTQFNNMRIKSIHRLLLGDELYENLGTLFNNDPDLIKNLQKKVFGSLPRFN